MTDEDENDVSHHPHSENFQMACNDLDKWLSNHDWPASLVLNWIANRPDFGLFVSEHKATIEKKLRNAMSTEDRLDVLAELEFAYRGIGQPGWRFKYEPYGTGKARSPDYQVSIGYSYTFNMEVKRVREGIQTLALHNFIGDVLTALSEVPTGCGAIINILDMDDVEGFIQRLVAAKPRVIESCVKAALEQTPRLADNDSVDVPLLGFDSDELRIQLVRMGHRPADYPTRYLAGGLSIPYTQRESFIFTDIICGALGQLRDGVPNVLAVRVQSCTHESIEFDYAISAIESRARAGEHEFFQKKGIADASQYLNLRRRLSAAVVVADWTSTPGYVNNHVWINTDAAIPLADQIIESLRGM